MALLNHYHKFITSPHVLSLTENSTLHLITSLVTIEGPSAITKHFQGDQLKFKDHKFLDFVEGPSSLAVIIETTLNFITGGGFYLPGLDDNFIADQNVTLPVIHFVSFDDDGKISNIRISWDQGCLLKLVNVIGKTGRNWPIRDGKKQTELILSSTSLTQQKLDDKGKILQNGIIGSKSQEVTKNATRDSHASLSLFTPRDHKMSEQVPVRAAPRSSAKPPARDYAEIFGSQEMEPSSPTRSPVSSRDRKKTGKARLSNQNFGPSRLFDVEENAQVKSSDKSMNPIKYKHFEFTDGVPNSGEENPIRKVKSGKHESHWDFDDFVTPQKIIPSKGMRLHDVRHWGNSDDEVMDSPERIKKVDRPRRDAETHFEFEDSMPQETEIRSYSRTRGQGNDNGLGLYKELFGEPEENARDCVKPEIHGIASAKDRQKDFEAHFTMTDKSPGVPKPEKMTDDKAKAVKMMDANWSSYDKSPTQKENNSASSFLSRNSGSQPLSETTNSLNIGNRRQCGIKTHGDGMGGRKSNESAWACGEFDDAEKEAGLSKHRKFRTGKQGGITQANNDDFWGF